MGYIKGQKQWQKWKKGEKLTRKEAIYAMFYECNGLDDSSIDCGGDGVCPLYPFSPYGLK